MKFCINCKHYFVHKHGQEVCCKQKGTYINPVDGKPCPYAGWSSCEEERLFSKKETSCGFDGRYWEAKDA